MPFPIGALRRYTEGEMSETAQIERYLWDTEDEHGNPQPYRDIAFESPCYAKALSGSETITAQRMGLDVSVKIVLPFGTDVTTEDRLIRASKRYEITYIPESSDSLRASVECFCKLIGEME